MNQNLIRYRHTRLDSIGLDDFQFILTDGIVESGKKGFEIEISGQSSGEIHFHSIPIEVREGKLTCQRLSVRKKDYFHNFISSKKFRQLTRIPLR